MGVLGGFLGRCVVEKGGEREIRDAVWWGRDVRTVHRMFLLELMSVISVIGLGKYNRLLYCRI